MNRAKFTVTKDYLWTEGDPADNYTGMVRQLGDIPDSAASRRFEVYDDDEIKYYDVTIDNCTDEVADLVFSFFMYDSGATYMKDVTGDGIDMSMG